MGWRHCHHLHISHQRAEPSDSQYFQTLRWRATVTEQIGLHHSQKYLQPTAPVLNYYYYFQISHLAGLWNFQILQLVVKSVYFQTLHQMSSVYQILHFQVVSDLSYSRYFQILAVIQADSHCLTVLSGLVHSHHFHQRQNLQA